MSPTCIWWHYRNVEKLCNLLSIVMSLKWYFKIFVFCFGSTQDIQIPKKTPNILPSFSGIDQVIRWGIGVLPVQRFRIGCQRPEPIRRRRVRAGGSQAAGREGRGSGPGPVGVPTSFGRQSKFERGSWETPALRQSPKTSHSRKGNWTSQMATRPGKSHTKN